MFTYTIFLLATSKNYFFELFAKEKYVIHYENLQLYLRLPSKLKTIPCVLKHNQQQLLKPYIDLNTLKKIQAENNDDKDEKALYKLMNNALYQNKMDNLRSKIDVKLGNKERDYLKSTLKANYMSCKIFDNNLLAICKWRLWIKLKNPACIGMCILEFSKVLMYKFHYYYIKNKDDSKSKLLFTDTNSLMYEIKTEDVYEDFSSKIETLDFSNYSTKSKFYDDSNKLVIEKMKNQTRGVGIEEFVGLKPKMYLFLHKIVSIKKKKAWIEMLLQQYFSYIYDTQWIEFKVKTMESESLKLPNIECLLLMTKYIFKTMDMMVYPLVTRFN